MSRMCLRRDSRSNKPIIPKLKILNIEDELKQEEGWAVMAMGTRYKIRIYFLNLLKSKK